jgi:tellurite resistance protein TehA-like permease
LILGRLSFRLLPETDILPGATHAGEIALVGGFIGALMLWGFGLLWFFFALAAILRSRPFPFNMGWWGFTFPVGVYSAATLQLGQEMESLFFKVLGTVSCASENPLSCDQTNEVVGF